MNSPDCRLTVGIVTRNRIGSLTRCVKSLCLIADLAREIIIVDDCSDQPVESRLREDLPPDFPIPITFIMQQTNEGPIVARNTMARLAASDLILSLDDDAAVLEAEPIKRAVELLRENDSIGAVAFAQADGVDKPWPESMQPSPTKYPCYVAAFIGFAAVLRRDTFISLGGYRSRFHYYGEEKEYCLRLINSGRDVIYLPDCLVGHFPDPSGRSPQRYLRHVIKNDCLGAIYNEPLPLMCLSISLRLASYFRMKRHMRIKDPGGLTWILKELIRPEVWEERRPLRWATFKKWRYIKKTWPPYEALKEGCAAKV